MNYSLVCGSIINPLDIDHDYDSIFIVDQPQSCMDHCTSTPGCTGVTFDNYIAYTNQQNNENNYDCFLSVATNPRLQMATSWQAALVLAPPPCSLQLT
jgi:hypothetical protein